MANAYQEMLTRAKQDAKESIEFLVSFAKAKAINTFDGWADYINSLEALDLSEMAHESAESWDTVIYHGKAIQLCIDMPSGEFGAAEEVYLECNGRAVEGVYLGGNSQPVGLFEMASGVAYWAVFHAVSDALQAEIDGCIELAESLQDNF
jgi:hypothetical protein